MAAVEPRNVPIYIGATGMKMMEMTGEIADGVCLNYLVNPKYNAEAMDALEREPRRPAAPSTTSTGRNW
jgi:5,10-methylenetetrahydromethanopterin reductase